MTTTDTAGAWPKPAEAFAADTARLARAATLHVRPLGKNAWGRNTYQVTGGDQPHVVSMAGSDANDFYHRGWCDCADYLAGQGGRFCKHLLAVAITLATDEDRAAVAALLGIE